MKNNLSFQVDKSWMLFLDRDGVLNTIEDNKTPRYIDEFKWIEGSEKALESLSKIFGRIIVITNQSSVARKQITKKELEKLHLDVQEYVFKYNGKIDAILYCPHLPEYKCKCRKPKAKLAMEAKSIFNDIQFNKSIMLGDSESDILFGKNLGMKTVLISSESNDYGQDMTCSSLLEFSDIISQ